MVQFNGATNEINIKIVYYSGSVGAGLASLEQVKNKLPGGNAGEIISLNTAGGQTLFFNFLPVSLGLIANHVVNLKLYAAPEAVYYSASRRIVLDGADAIIFIGDPRKSKAQYNAQLLTDLISHLKETGVVPVVFQWDFYNRTEEKGERFTAAEMRSMFNRSNLPEVIADSEEKVLIALKETVKQVVATL